MNFTMFVKERTVISHRMETIGDCDKRIASSHIAILRDSDDCCMRDTMAYSASPASTSLLHHQLAYPLWPPILLNHEVPSLKVVVFCLVDGEIKWETSC